MKNGVQGQTYLDRSVMGHIYMIKSRIFRKLDFSSFPGFLGWGLRISLLAVPGQYAQLKTSAAAIPTTIPPSARNALTPASHSWWNVGLRIAGELLA